MGQKPSRAGGRFGSPFTLSRFFPGHKTTHNPNPEQPIKFQYKKRRRHSLPQQDKNQNKSEINNSNTKNNKPSTNNKINQSVNDLTDVKNVNINNVKCKIVKTQNAPVRTKSEPSLLPEKRDKRRRRKCPRMQNEWHTDVQQFGYEIYDIDTFLAKASIEKPANIPVVLAFPSVLYQTRVGGYQDEISLPLGMVVNAVFKNQHWLYVQTPHAEEGYVSYAACLPLGIIPPPDDDTTPAPCWEKSTDVFPKPSGNMTDTEKLSSKSECGGESRCHSRNRSRNAASTCGEKSVDRLYLRATAFAKSRGTRQTLLVITKDYIDDKENILCVGKGEVVSLLGTPINGWFWVRNKEGEEGFIPAAVAGHGFL